MSLLYRAIWQDSRSDLSGVGRSAFAEWIRDKRIDSDVPDEGAASGTYRDGAFELLSRRTTASGVEAIQLELSEDRPESAERWTTRLTTLQGETDSYLWVDLERVADDLGESSNWAAPRLVRNLIESGLEAGSDPRVDQVRLSSDAQGISATGLSGLIRNLDRTLPLVVFSEDPQRGFTPTLQRANAAAHRLMGAAQVMVLTSQYIDEFEQLIGDELAVQNGDVRIYLPNSGQRGLEPDRHRTIALDRLGDDPGRPARMLAAMLATTVTARRPPSVYEEVRKPLRLGGSGTATQLLEFADIEIKRLTHERDELKDQLAKVSDELLDTQIDLDAATTDSLRRQNQLQIMLISQRGDEEAISGTVDLAIEPITVSEAVSEAHERLTGVVIAGNAGHDLEDLDSAPNSRAWGETTWKGLRALHIYAEAQFSGNFKEWCKQSGHYWAWPASDKKLSMTESTSVRNSPRLADQRLFAIDTRVEPSGRIHMWSHLKIAEGGGRLAPRIYFHDDTSGPTGLVHVGFIGPHHHTENTRTN